MLIVSILTYEIALNQKYESLNRVSRADLFIWIYKILFFPLPRCYYCCCNTGIL